MENNLSVSDMSNIHHRMSRIITKLFNRVLKAEGNETVSFDGDTFDMEGVLRSLDTAISKSQPHSSAHSVAMSEGSDLTDLDSMAGDKMAPCRNMCNILMIELLKAKHAQNKAAEVKIALRAIGHIRETHAGRLFISCCNELGLESLLSPAKGRSTPSQNFPASAGDKYDADQLSELIFAVGGAEEDDDRVNALEDLRSFVDAHPGINLESHLSGLSVPFRKYILEQMKSPFRPAMRQSSRSLLSGYTSVPSRAASTRSFPAVPETNQANMTMSEKLRYLKSKINAAEETAQSVIDTGNTASRGPLPPPEQTSPPSSNNYSTLRQRLAAASEKRSQAISPESEQQVPFESAALGNAAILRARLESVKRMNTQYIN
jgi:hypothetical protein